MLPQNHFRKSMLGLDCSSSPAIISPHPSFEVVTMTSEGTRIRTDTNRISLETPGVR